MSTLVSARELVQRLVHPLNKRTALLGLDVGDAATGVALAAAAGGGSFAQAAVPLTTVRRTKLHYDKLVPRRERGASVSPARRLTRWLTGLPLG